MTLRSIVCFAAALCAFGAAAKSPADYVNPMIGTDGMGHTFPGACAPFGIVQLSPDTDTIPHNVAGKYQKEVYETCAGYRYGDPTIVGFSHTHFSGTGHSDLGDILVMPGVGKVKIGRAQAHTPGHCRHLRRRLSYVYGERIRTSRVDRLPARGQRLVVQTRQTPMVNCR